MAIANDASPCASCAFTPSSLLPSVAERDSLHAHLRSNLPPSDQVVSDFRFRTVVDTGPAELARYDAHIDSLRARLDALATERDKLATHIDGCRSLFESPIRTMPTEILARILELYARDPPPEPHYFEPIHESQRIGKSYLLEIATVCWHWREIVMGTPVLWSDITLALGYWTSDLFEQNLALLASTLARSSSSLLTVNISCDSNLTTSHVLPYLVGHVSRWQSANFSLDPESFASIAAVAGEFTQLRTLELATNHLWIDSFHAPLTLFEVTPLLRRVVLEGKPQHVPSESFRLPWGQITEFKYAEGFHVFTPTDCRRLPLSELSQGCAVELEVVMLDDISATDDGVDFLQRTRESLMGSLEVSVTVIENDELEYKGAWLGCILDTFTLPALTRFSLQPGWPHGNLSWNHDKFSQLSERSGFGEHLFSLTILAEISEAELLDTLKSLPNLAELVIGDVPREDHILVTDSLMRALTIPHLEPTGSAILVPRLRLLQLLSSLSFTDDVFLSMLKSRIVQCELRYRFTLDLRWMGAAGREPGEEFLMRLRELERAGRFTSLSGPVAD
ncbi:hypothetical protein C8F01DRAFT_1138114 [Mycena amicta]|nr:hypothetical protein C8F01DRAFT_1138114 [Mycena amicta]